MCFADFDCPAILLPSANDVKPLLRSHTLHSLTPPSRAESTAPPSVAAASPLIAGNASKEQLFAEVSSTCTGLITRIALSYEADPALRRELVQDILLAIWMALPSYRGEASLKSFAAAIAQKRCITHVTKRAREPRQVELPVDLASTTPAPDEIALRKDQRRQLVDSIQLLPSPQREAIVL